MGLDHSGVHDKSEFAQLCATDQQLLSICFCRSCQLGLRESRIDERDLARRVRDAVGTNATSLEEALGDELANEVATYRVALATTLRQALLERVRHEQPGATVTLHASPQRWATGSFPPAGDGATLSSVTTTVALGRTQLARLAPQSRLAVADSAFNESELRALHDLARGRSTLRGYVRVDQGWSDDALVDETIRRYVDAGMEELHLYHLGLLSRTSLIAAQRVVAAFRKQWNS